MLFFTAVQNTQPDYVALAIVAVFAVIVLVMAIRKRLANKTPVTEAVETATPAEPTAKVAAPGSAGQIKLHSVDPKTAAMVMAITANKLGKPLNELRFISIKEVQ